MSNKDLTQLIKYTRQLVIYILCSKKLQYYNFIIHQMKYLISKYRKYTINIKYINPDNYIKYANNLGIYSFPSYIFTKYDNTKIYRGMNINKIEHIILEFIH